RACGWRRTVTTCSRWRRCRLPKPSPRPTARSGAANGPTGAGAVSSRRRRIRRSSLRGAAQRRRSNPGQRAPPLDCFVASLLAMTACVGLEPAPMSTTQWWWVRHAPVPDGGRIYGQRDLDCDCSDGGIFTALAKELPQEAVWVTSNLKRATQTAAAIHAAMG